MRISKPTLFFGLFVVISASFTQQILFYFFETFGKRQTATTLGIFFVLIGVAVIIYIFKQKIANLKKLCFCWLFILGLVLSWRMPIVAERIHILEYGLLGWLTLKDASKKYFSPKTIPFSLSIILVFSLMDEGFQFILPNRIADWRDVFINLIGGCWGMGLFLMSPKLMERKRT
ncbi:MAG: VanZ family protein [Candidatus Omnitrophota bacterium]|nr:VanZ family protein [Candidatus Omnitrophota bacterium]